MNLAVRFCLCITKLTFGCLTVGLELQGLNFEMCAWDFWPREYILFALCFHAYGCTQSPPGPREFFPAKHSATILFRSREFLWQEGHTAFATKEEADEEVITYKYIFLHSFDMVLLSTTPLSQIKRHSSTQHMYQDQCEITKIPLLFSLMHLYFTTPKAVAHHRTGCR